MLHLYIIMIALLFVNVDSQSTEYHIHKESKNTVRFISQTPLENYDGSTDQIDGYVKWESDDFLMNSEIYFEVDLASLDTGIDLRNRHMRDNYLETDKYPYAQFSGKIIKAEKNKNNSFKVIVEGKMKIHGVDRSFSTQGTVILENDIFHIQCEFTIKLTDYDIKVPKIMFFKIDENVHLIVDFYVNKIK